MTDGRYVYVTGGDTVWVYSRAAIDAAGDGQRVAALYEYRDVPASSFTTLHDGRLYVGTCFDGDPGSLYSYELGPNGTLLGDDGLPRVEDPVSPVMDGSRYEGITPPNSHGVEVYGNGSLFTQSQGEGKPSELYYRPFGSARSARSATCRRSRRAAT